VQQFGPRAKFIVENYGDSKLARRFGVTRYPAIFVNDILVATPSDFGFYGAGQSKSGGRYAPLKSAESHARFQADLTKVIRLVLAGRGDAARAAVPAQPAAAIAALPELHANDIDGKPVTKASLSGRVVAVEFWATWCPPCRGTLEWLDDAKKKYGDRLEVVTIAVESEPKAVKELLGRRTINLMATPEIGRAFGDVSALPTLFVFDRAGKTAGVFYGAPPGAHAAAERVIEEAMGGAVAAGVQLLPGRFQEGSQPDGNTVILRGPHGLVVVDTGRHEEHTRAIVRAARELEQPVAAIVNTHWHLDHIGGNALLRREYPGVKIYASGAFAEARKGFLARYRRQLEELMERSQDKSDRAPLRAEMALIDAGDALAPDVVIDSSGERTLAGRPVDVHLVRNAVTAGDLWLFDPATKTLVSGDLVTLPVPLFDTACPAGWERALDELDHADFQTLIPGHGAPMQRRGFETYRTAFRNLTACSRSSRAKDACVEGWMRDAAPLIRNDDPKFARFMAGYYVEKVLRGDPAKLEKACAPAS
jgi:glyoxylase-like metal-dependent hydrolase (beta-lactamase superfamily II)